MAYPVIANFSYPELGLDWLQQIFHDWWVADFFLKINLATVRIIQIIICSSFVLEFRQEANKWT
jgi:hypothetical protein